MYRISALFLASIITSTPAIAAPEIHHGHHAVTVTTRSGQPRGATAAYEAAMNKMHRGMDITYTGDADADFARGMIPHHQGAVDMANVQLRYGKDEELKDLCRRIIQAQELEIGRMQQWLTVRNANGRAPKSLDTQATREYRAAMDKMHAEMMVPYTGDADVDFVRGMIPHHLGAVEMAKVEKKHGRDPMLNALADDVIRTQQQEVQWMREWLKRHKK